MSGLLQGKVAVVTGAARGQGRSHCVRLAEEGADIVAMDICAPIATVQYPMAAPEDLARTVELVETLDRRIIATKTDVRDGEAVAAALDAGVAEFGRLDVVVANAGIAGYLAAVSIDEDTWRDMIDTNLTGVWHVCRAAMPHLIEAKRGGSMILISSSAAHIGTPHISHYSAAKSGLVGLMRSLAVELGPYMIRVNTIHPTGVNTPMMHNEATYDLFVPGGASEHAQAERTAAVAEVSRQLNAMPVPWVEPVDISNAVVFLASDQGRYITGTELRVDAGAAAK